LEQTAPSYDDRVAALLHAAYDPTTIDYEPDADYRQEVRTWRCVDHADDEASRVALDQDNLVGASLIAEELDAPFLYEVVVHPAHRHRGVAFGLLATSVGVLAHRRADLVAAWVTHGNTSSERLLSRAGFRPVTPSLTRDLAMGIYRAAEAVATLPAEHALAIAAEPLAPGRARLWLIGDHARPMTAVRVKDTDVEIRWLSATNMSEIAAPIVPLRGAAFVLSMGTGDTPWRPHSSMCETSRTRSGDCLTDGRGVRRKAPTTMIGYPARQCRGGILRPVARAKRPPTNS
jgi:GNAT superfamily N-acetyltransferase